MDETIKHHLDAIADHLKGKPNAFIFLMSSKAEDSPEGDLHIVQNCTNENAASLIVSCLDSKIEIAQAFTDIVSGLELTEKTKNDE